MKSILFIMPNLTGGGAEKVLIDILNHSDFTKFKITLCLIEKTGVYLNRVPSEIEIIPLYKNRGVLYKFEFALARYFGIDAFQKKRINKAIENTYDVIVSFMEGIPLQFHSLIKAKAHKNITWVHIDLFKKHYTNQYFFGNHEKQSYLTMDNIAFVSQDAKKGFETLFNYKADKCKVILNPIDKERIWQLSACQINIKKSKFTFCAVGRLMYQKSFDRLIRVAKKITDVGEDVEFWILGVGPLEKELRTLTHNLDLDNVVKFLGFQENPYPFIKMSDAFISTSMTEGYPLVICEAICLEKPILATKVTGPKEILGNSEYGLLTDEDDDSIFNNAMKILKDSSLREHYINQARIRKNMFEIDSAVNDIYSFILQ